MGFKRLDAEDFVVSADSVQSTAWSTGLPTLTHFLLHQYKSRFFRKLLFKCISNSFYRFNSSSSI
jgi:hypothetical protein